MQKRTEAEVANTLTHLLGVILSIIASVYLISLSKESNNHSLIPICIFCAGMIMLYSASTAYHWAMPGKTKRILRHFDHIGIYVLIAASYTPVWLIVIGGVYGWVAFAIIWAIAIGGSIGKIVALGKYPKLSLAIYLIMGWSAVFAAKAVWTSLTATALWWLLLEGLFYSGGAYFYAKGSKSTYFHAIWHLFVLLGTFAHFMVVLNILQNTI